MQAEIRNLTNEEYHSCDGVSSSGISLLLCNPYKYWHRYLSGNYNEESSESMSFGSLIHTFLLEPDELDKRYFIAEKTRKGTKAWAELELMANGREIICQEKLDSLNQIKKMVDMHEAAKDLLCIGKAEQSIFWGDEETGVLCKSRPDFFNSMFITDVKTTSNIDSFEWSFIKYGYHRQAAMAVDAIKALTGDTCEVYHLVIENSEPYIIQAYNISAEMIEKGRDEYKKGLQIYKECKEKNEWPSYSEAVKLITLRAA